MKIDPVIAGVVALLSVASILTVAFMPYEELKTVWSDATTILLAAVAAILCFNTARSRGYLSTPYIVWMLITLGMFLWFVGELAWGIYEVILNVELPYPSLADVAYLVAYLPIYIGVCLNLSRMKGQLKMHDLIIPVAISLLSLALLTKFIFLDVLSNWRSGFWKK